ncbi:MAG TPA: nitrate reductase molybdenum cofactor assembly chaperone [Acidiferrobacteraceae bacterium]|nr:nitrate reductase molybdenum cofactor assembly chaperone [Acidiferrobacteraceae bacterium]
MLKIYKILSVLIDYPNDELLLNLEQVKSALDEPQCVNNQERKILREHIEWMQNQQALELQGLYIQTFDMAAEHALYLTHHLLGDDRERGPALVDLQEFYKNTGWQAVDNELPDYLPMILEYASNLDEMGARMFLREAVGAISILAANLEKTGSPYAKLMRLLENRASILDAAANS